MGVVFLTEAAPKYEDLTVVIVPRWVVSVCHCQLALPSVFGLLRVCRCIDNNNRSLRKWGKISVPTKIYKDGTHIKNSI